MWSRASSAASPTSEVASASDDRRVLLERPLAPPPASSRRRTRPSGSRRRAPRSAPEAFRCSVYELRQRWKSRIARPQPPPPRRARARLLRPRMAPASRAASIASHSDIDRIAWASSTDRISSTSRISCACWCSHAETMLRPRSEEPPCATKRPRVPRVSIRPSASRLESASRRTVRETPSSSTSTRSGGSRSPAASFSSRIWERIVSIAPSTSDPSRRRSAGSTAIARRARR